jgi:PAS domain S-box-containing protein
LADSIPQLAWIAGPDGAMIWHNKRFYEYTGASPDSAQQWRGLVDAGDLPKVQQSYDEAIARGERWECILRLRRHDGIFRSHLSLALPIRDESGQILRWFGTCTDITERVEFEEALRETDRRKDQFLATLAHELRNPLAPISNALQVWPFVEHQPEEMERLREMMERQVQQMIRLIDDLLDVSRITRGKIQLRKQSLNLCTVVKSAAEAILPFATSTGHMLNVNIPEESLLIEGDVARLVQVVSNLLHNAVKYTDREARIWVSAWREDHWAVISVKDNGPGIPPGMLSRIFELFTQVDQSLGRAHGGLGIGLTLAKSLVELHGGTIEARSQGPGTGSEFLVKLPMQSEFTTVTESPQQLLDRFVGIPSHRVLVVDDMSASANTLALLLNAIGQEVEVTYDGRSALEAAAELRPHVVFLDIGMPGMDGYEVARQLRANSELNGVSLVALTGYGQEEDRRRAFEAGFDHHLVKPTSIELLEQVLRQVAV